MASPHQASKLGAETGARSLRVAEEFHIASMFVKARGGWEVLSSDGLLRLQ